MADFTARINLDINDTNLSDVEKRIQDLSKNSHQIQIDINDHGKIKDISDKLNALTKTPVKIRLDIDDKKLKSFINAINIATATAARNGGTVFSQNFVKNINAPQINQHLSSVLNSLSSKGADQTTLDEVSKRMDTLMKKGIQINKIVETFNDKTGLISLKIDGVDELGDAITLMESLNRKTGKWSTNTKFTNVLNDTARQAREAAKEINELQRVQRKVAEGDYQAQTAKMRASVSRYNNATLTSDLRNAVAFMQQYEAEVAHLNSIDPNIDATAYLEAARNIELYGNRFSNAMTIVDNTIGKNVNAHKRLKLEADISDFITKNTRAVQKYRNELEALKSDASGIQTQADYQDVNTRFSSLKSQVKADGLMGSGLMGSLSKAGTSFLAKFVSIQQAVHLAVETTKTMVKTVVEIDTAMTSLYKVTNNTAAEYENFTNAVKKSAVEIGRTTSSLIEQSAEWAKLGYTLSEAQELAKVSSIYANVGEVDDKTAVSDIVAVLKAYDMQSSEAMSVVDMLNELGKYLPLYIVIYRSKSSYIG